MADQKAKEELLRYEIKRSLLLSDEDKEFWLAQTDEGLPEAVVNSLFDEVIKKNASVDSYLDAALVEDNKTNHAANLKTIVKNANSKAFAMDEKNEKINLDAQLDKELENQ